MRNKDKYDLREVEAKIVYKVGGCGRNIPETRTIKILHKGELLYEEQGDRSIWQVFMEWLESDD